METSTSALTRSILERALRRKRRRQFLQYHKGETSQNEAVKNPNGPSLILEKTQWRLLRHCVLVAPFTSLERLSRGAEGHHGVTRSEELATSGALFTGIAREGVTSSFLICERSELDVFLKLCQMAKFEVRYLRAKRVKFQKTTIYFFEGFLRYVFGSIFENSSTGKTGLKSFNFSFK